jgi:hypothetical protein
MPTCAGCNENYSRQIGQQKASKRRGKAHDRGQWHYPENRQREKAWKTGHFAPLVNAILLLKRSKIDRLASLPRAMRIAFLKHSRAARPGGQSTDFTNGTPRNAYSSNI